MPKAFCVNAHGPIAEAKIASARISDVFGNDEENKKRRLQPRISL
jgi:hypothetical protein